MLYNTIVEEEAINYKGYLIEPTRQPYARGGKKYFFRVLQEENTACTLMVRATDRHKTFETTKNEGLAHVKDLIDRGECSGGRHLSAVV